MTMAMIKNGNRVDIVKNIGPRMDAVKNVIACDHEEIQQVTWEKRLHFDSFKVKRCKTASRHVWAKLNYL